MTLHLGRWVALNEVLDPYDLRMGQAGAVTVDHVRAQAAVQGLLDEPDVRLAMGKAYAKVATAVWPHAHNILAGTTGIGLQMLTLGQQTRYFVPMGATR